MHLKIYTGTLKKRPIFTVYWRAGEKPFRKLFADPIKVEDFAKAQAEQLAAGQAHAPAISITDAQTFREAQRRLGPVDVPLRGGGASAPLHARRSARRRAARVGHDPDMDCVGGHQA